MSKFDFLGLEKQQIDLDYLFSSLDKEAENIAGNKAGEASDLSVDNSYNYVLNAEFASSPESEALHLELQDASSNNSIDIDTLNNIIDYF